jgi:Tfp pilus assembly protein PilF
MNTQQFGLRSTVRLYGTVVEQGVNWKKHLQWTPIDATVPTQDNRPPGHFRWVDDRVEIRDSHGCVTSLSGPETKWEWSNGDGVGVSIDRIQMVRARRSSGEAWGDVALLVMMLTLMVGLGQAKALFTMIVGDRVKETASLAPSPELIARLLRQEFAGEDQGRISVTKRPELKRKVPSYFMPAGSNGPIERMGGGSKAGDTTHRTSGQGETSKAVAVGSEPKLRQPDGHRSLQSEQVLPLHVPTETYRPANDTDDPTVLAGAVERFVGWGFRDWLEAAEMPESEKTEMQQRSELAQQLLRIDPDDPFAMLTLSNYAYLAENYALCRTLYARYLRLYPADAAGWNNLALTYKRTHEYAQEEELYRLALALEPGNFFTKNNLAVNLAHQGRFQEAQALMTDLRPRANQRPYAELHLAKIAASQRKERRAYRHLKRALTLAYSLGTSHHIEFRQDIRLDPSFDTMRSQSKFRRLLRDTYGGVPEIGPATAQKKVFGVNDG